MSRVLDCTMFHREFDLLELRLHELWDVVDIFSVTESQYTFRGAPRELALSPLPDRFAWASKKLHVHVSGRPYRVRSSWDLEQYQRQMSVANGLDLLVDPQPTDLIIVTDLDEIPRASTIQRIRGRSGVYTLLMPMFYYTVNLYGGEWFPPKASSYDQIYNPNMLRHTPPQDTTILMNAGWHFSWLGDPEFMLDKMTSFAHDEFPEFENIDLITRAVAEQRDLLGRNVTFTVREIDDTWPQYILDHLDQYADRISVSAPGGIDG